MTYEQLAIEAQGAVDELWAEQVIPFKLTASKVDAGEDLGHYTVHFFETQLHSLFVYWNPERESFKTAAREVLKGTVGKRSRVQGAGQNPVSMNSKVPELPGA